MKTIRATATLARAEDRIRHHGVSALAVIDDAGGFVGVVSLRDLLRASKPRVGEGRRALELIMPSEGTVADVMTRDLETVSPEETIAQAAARMWNQRIHRVFVVSGDELHGVISARDVMLAVAYSRVADEVSHIMSAPLLSIDVGELAEGAVARLASEPVSGLVVMEDGQAVGVFGQEEALIAKHLGPRVAVDVAMSPAVCSVPSDSPLFRVAQQASVMDVRRIVVLRDGMAVGAVSGLDFCRFAAERAGSHGQ